MDEDFPDLNPNLPNGVTVGIVRDLDDPQKIGRVQVEYPLYENKKSAWARLVVPMATKDKGTFFRPEKGDEVLVVFEQGDPRQPYVLGALWSKVAPPPPEALPVQNDLRLIVSKSGHVLRFNDRTGKELVELVDKTGDRRLTVESAGKRVRVYAKTGNVEVVADSGNVKVTAKKGSIDLDARTVNLKASGNVKVQAGGTLTLKGKKVDIN